MKQQLDDEKIYRLYLAQKVPDLPKSIENDLMNMAEAADLGGDLSFLSQPITKTDVPVIIRNRAILLGAKNVSSSLPESTWLRNTIAFLTFVVSSSGSYALATTLGMTSNSTNVSNTTSLESEDLFEIASTNNFLTLE